MTQLLFDPWLAGITLVAILLLATWAATLPPLLSGEAPSFPLTYARRTAFQRQRDPDAAGRPRSRAP
ncbi:hypothetical protein SAMN05444920_104462 [Nonomuraea solani]|uniref:Uncharacterized protein n=1 Tax=Nonomuraea solani TaxID=1144553 RepID=A0A1H6CXZ3_9ACTN|nr:DUF6412 domain-containing protein [Nonomuraea solani]SEG77246.1 hypothetical protein SAMN05444920_104462 [Nonomuraea solani]